eukprot:gene24679-32144_t
MSHNKLFSSLAENTKSASFFNVIEDNRSASTDFSHTSTSSTIRPKLRVQDLLNGESVDDISIRQKISISSDCSIRDAVTYLVTENKGSSMVISPPSAESNSGEIAGIITARDLLRFINNKNLLLNDNDLGDHSSSGYTVADVMTSREKLIYCSPTDTLRRCREIMFHRKVRNLPVIEEEAVAKEDQVDGGQR